MINMKTKVMKIDAGEIENMRIEVICDYYTSILKII